MKHRIKMSSIKVPRSYQLSNPQRDKMNACRTYFRQNGRIDRDIVVNKSNTIKDGYIYFFNVILKYLFGFFLSHTKKIIVRK